MDRIQHLLRTETQKLVLLGTLLMIIVGLSFASSTFLTVTNFTNVFLKVAVIVIIASAANMLMITGHFDMSVGSVLALSGILHAYMCKHGVPIELSILITCVVAMCWGAVNALTVAVLGINPVIATVGVLFIARGFAFLIARWDGGANIMTGLPMEFVDFGRELVFGIFPLAIVLMVLSLLVFIFVEKKTALGRLSYAVGTNIKAAKLSGINTVGIIGFLYMMVALFAGLSGVLQTSRVGLASPSVGNGLEFDVIVAIILGGTSMMGGVGSTVGMLLGALVVGFSSNGLNLLGIPFYYQSIAYGVILIGSLMLNHRFTNMGRG
ncbi:ABC transporter permease [Polycladidibacter stylochi]|uniref:ABC transporter permease n=1 Tax=Polycladidibacter stylochi TaxID=1807766 RepID=UPI00082CCD27|nr:ABC transporter permease [Pseudovibrio stylochi]